MSRLKRCAAVHDLAGFGRVSLTAIMPTLSAMGIQVCPVPTAVLSTHTGGDFAGYSFIDLTATMRETIAHWRKLGLTMDAVYSGFLGSPEQCQIVSGMIDAFADGDPLIVVDPVMGDRGRFYPSISPEMAQEMRELVKKADVVTPNLTELFLLLNEPYREDLSPETLDALIIRLSGCGPERIVVTSAPSRTPGAVDCRVFDRGRFTSVTKPLLKLAYQGTGDLYAAVMVGQLLNGKSFDAACAFAADVVYTLLDRTSGSGEPHTDGVFIEAYLPELAASVDRSALMVDGFRELGKR